MINWKPASEPPSDGREVFCVEMDFGRLIKSYKAVAQGKMYFSYFGLMRQEPTHWCELSELNLPAGGDV